MSIQYPCYNFSQYSVKEIEVYRTSMFKWSEGTAENEGSNDYLHQAHLASRELSERKELS